MMKKIAIFIASVLFGFSIMGCQSTVETLTDQDLSTDLPTTRNGLTNPLTWDAIIPSYSQFDQEIFEYANVYIYLLDDNQDKELYLNESGLDHANYDAVYLSTYTNLILLTYKSKVNLLNDFYLLQNIYLEGEIQRPMMNIKTIMKSFEMTATNTVDDLIEVTDQYFGTEIIYNTIGYDMVEDIQLETLPTEFYLDYHTYLDDYSDNRFDLAESDFDEQVLLVASFGHSSSLTIQGFELFYIDGNQLELAVLGQAVSIQMAEDFRPYTVVMFIPADVYQVNSQLIMHFHTHFLDGTYADRPYHNTVDEERD